MAPSKGILLHLATKLAPEASLNVSWTHRLSSSVYPFGLLTAEQFHRSAEVCDAGHKEESGASSSSGDTALASRGPYASRLGNRGVLRFDGEDTVRFLQGLVTNDLSKFDKEPPKTSSPQPTPNQAAAHHLPLYAALLNPQGRFLYDLFFYRPTHCGEKLDRTGSGPASGDGDTPKLLADVDAESLDDLVSLLKRHRLRAKVDIQNVSQDMSVWQRYGGASVTDPDNELSAAGGIGWGASEDTTGQIAAESNNRAWRWWKDPRLSTLGLRGLFPSNTTPPLVEADQEVDLRYYQLWRLEQGVPEGPKEIHQGEAIPLEYNLDALNAISFDKGCYVGQELIARTHHRGVIRKRIMPVNFLKKNGEEAQQAVGDGAEVVDCSTERKVGKITTVLGPRGLGLIRLEALRKDAQLGIPDMDIHVKAVRPKWWPQEWGHEEYPPRAVSSA